MNIKETKPRRSESNKIPEYLSSEISVKVNTPPLIENFLNSNQEFIITPELFTNLIKISAQYEQSNILLNSVRQYGIGYEPNLVGQNMTAQTTLDTFLKLESEELNKINKLPDDVQEEFFESLKPEGRITPRAFFLLDLIHTNFLTGLKYIRSKNIYATHLRERNGHELSQMFYEINTTRPFLHKKINKTSPIYSGVPRIDFFPKFQNGRLKTLEQAVVMMKLDKIEIEKPNLYYSKKFDDNNPDHWTNVADVIKQVTPEIFKRENWFRLKFKRNDDFYLIFHAGRVSFSLMQLFSIELRNRQDIQDLITYPTLAKEQFEILLTDVKQGYKPNEKEVMDHEAHAADVDDEYHKIPPKEH